MVKLLLKIFVISWFYAHSVLCFEFPMNLHFIWLGGAPYSSDEAKVKQWIENNPAYEIYIWYSIKDLTRREKINKIRGNNNHVFLDYKENKILSKDLVIEYLKQQFNPDNAANVHISALENFWELIQEHENSLIMDKGYFLDTNTKKNLIDSFYEELTIQESCPNGINLAAASDIARILLLYYYGGVYFDFDVYSISNYKLNITPNFTGFKFAGKFSPGFNEINNNLLASISHGEIVTRIARKISKNYHNLRNASKNPTYTDEKVSNFFSALSSEIASHETMIEFDDVSYFCEEYGMSTAQITEAQEKKFNDAFYPKKRYLGSLSATNEKIRITSNTSGPNCLYKILAGSIIKVREENPDREPGDKLEDLLFPSDYIGPAVHLKGSWSE